ncbi:MAG: hypothetical protein PWP52_1647 [Bacteroidales bacterium]|nr:hypothetical protein [Bacteroidales bacterium]MDN5355787.1 hypothetical protein [Rikenellaceae bacterium]
MSEYMGSSEEFNYSKELEKLQERRDELRRREDEQIRILGIR